MKRICLYSLWDNEEMLGIQCIVLNLEEKKREKVFELYILGELNLNLIIPLVPPSILSSENWM